MGLTVLGIMAGHLADIFGSETDKQDLRGGLGLSWFTKTTLTADSSQIQNVIASDGGLAVTGGGAFSAFTAIDGILIGGIVGFTKGVLTFLAGGVSFGLAMAAAVMIGSAMLGQQAQDYLNQEEAELA